MMSKTFEEFYSELKSTSTQDIKNALEEASKDLKKCTAPFEVRDIIKQQQETINSQKAEIERLQGCVKSEDEVREIMKSQMFPMIEEATKEQIDKAFALGKVEGVIEFAERLKEKYSMEIDGYYGEVVFTCDIDDLVKEMVGEG